MTQIPVPRIIHTIHNTTDIYGCRLLYQDALGGLVFAENYFPEMDRDCALLYVANHMIEPMSARTPDDMTKPYARMAAKIGQAYHSFELKVPDGKVASQAFRDGGAKVASDFGSFFFVKAESTGGIMLEVCELDMPNDPYDRIGPDGLNSWTSGTGLGHASGVLRLDHIACVTSDMALTLRFFTELCDGTVLSDEATTLPQLARRVLVQLGDTRIAFIQPDDAASGALGTFSARPNNGIYALVWQVADMDKAKAHFSNDRLNLRLTSKGCVSPGFAIEPDDFFGARHEFIPMGM